MFSDIMLAHKTDKYRYKLQKLVGGGDAAREPSVGIARRPDPDGRGSWWVYKITVPAGPGRDAFKTEYEDLEAANFCGRSATEDKAMELAREKLRQFKEENGLK